MSSRWTRILAGTLIAEWRDYAVDTLLACAAVWLVGLPLYRWGSRVEVAGRERLLRDVAREGMPLVEALSRFTAESGHAPGELEELVPEYLPRLPADLAERLFSYYPRGGADWDLVVFPDPGFLNFDQIAYDPDHQVDGPRSGDWAWFRDGPKLCRIQVGGRPLRFRGIRCGGGCARWRPGPKS